jgi:hypothetical protein
MADKRFHITPGGAELCRARFKPCQYTAHYASLEIARNSDAIIKENNAFLAEIKQLHENHRNPDPKVFSRSSFSFDKGSSSPRAFGREVDARIDRWGVKPEIYHSMGQFRMNNGNGMDVNAQVMRLTEVDEELARYVGVWRFTVKSNKVGLVRHAKVVRQEVFDFSTAEAVRESMPKVTELFRTAAIASGLYDEEKANRQTEKMLEHFIAMFNAVESDAAGELDVQERGMGYFTDSDNGTIVVNEDYRTSAFRAESFKRYLAAHPVYRAHQPEVEIKVSDSHSRTGASWALKKKDGQWSVEKGYDDGASEVVNISTPQDALDHVYYHVLAQINPDNDEKALEKGRFAGALVQGVETALEANKAVIDDWWRKTSHLGG